MDGPTAGTGGNASREINLNGYVGDGRGNFDGGGTYTNPNGTKNDPTLKDYENIFGPAARDIKFDLQRNKRHSRWHLPDALKGPNPWLTDRIDGLITDTTSSPFTTRILPYKYIEQVDAKLKWNSWSFDEGLSSRVPYESAARTLTQTKRSYAGYTVRQGLAITMEHNFMMSEKGRENFKHQLQQVVGSIQYTNDIDVHIALITAPSYAKEKAEKYMTQNKTNHQVIREYIDLFGFMQKNNNAIDIMIEDAKAVLRSWGAADPDFLLTNSKLTFQMTMIPEKTEYLTQGIDGIKRLRQGPNISSYRGLSIINTRQFSMEDGTPPRDVLRRRVRVAEYYRIPADPHAHERLYELYDEAKDAWQRFTWEQLWKMSQLNEEPIMGYPAHDDSFAPAMPGPDGGMYVSKLPDGEAPFVSASNLRKASRGDAKLAAGPGSIGSDHYSRAAPPTELVIIRPNIEHNMLGIIIGKGGLEELGATLWGQTELAVYDDSMHGIWGMSYKYNERAIVFNQKNLIRLWDVAYDGYNGGKETNHVIWHDQHSRNEFEEKTYDLNRPYEGPSMMVMAFDQTVETPSAWPSPIVFHDDGNNHNDGRVDYLDGEHIQRVKRDPFRVFNKRAYSEKYQRYKTHMPDFSRIHNGKQAGNSSHDDETNCNTLAFQGTYRVFSKEGQHLYTVTGNGHHGEDYVGAASRRAGKGSSLVPNGSTGFQKIM